MKTIGVIGNFISFFQQVRLKNRLKNGLKYWSAVSLGLVALSSSYADQQPFNLQIHLKTSNLQPVPPVAAATWCNTIKNNLPRDAIPANPSQPIIKCSPEEGGLLVNLNLQYTPPPPATPVHFINSAGGTIHVYSTNSDGSDYSSGNYNMGGEWDAVLRTGSGVRIYIAGGSGSNKSKNTTVPAPNSNTHRATLECSGVTVNWKCRWSS